ncbi:MAG: Mut7-C RNAse domain-containing protein [Candidatus Heimdallarchaeota archaeon]|nr:Mut7-C RNAse domain-containing protein [Candidatus Heimdallarchaeota archaeon]
MINEKGIKNEKFIVDVMYQRIARWLRMLGYDTEIVKESVDYKILKKAKEEKRILITRDEDLKRKARKIGVKAISIDGETIEERLARLQKEMEIKLFLSEKTLPRCSLCNGQIAPIKKEEIKEGIPEGTWNQYNEFWICLNEICKQIYWRGSHWEKIEKSLEASRRLLSEELEEEKQKKKDK